MKTKIIVLLSVLIFALGMFISCGDPMTSESTGETVSSTETATETETGSETATETETGSETGSETTSETHEHVYAFVEWVNAPTLTETGKAKMKCECNEEKEEDVPALGDATVWTKGADVADACVGGEVEYTSEKYGKVTVQVAPKHQFGELVPAKAATCVAAGNIAYKECTVCHNFFHEDETPVEGNVVEIPVNPDNHTPKDAVKENEVLATCLVVGSYDSVVRCKDCDTVISSEHIVGELGDHNFVSGACSVCHLAEKYSGANVNLYGTVTVFKSVMTFDKKGVTGDKAIKYETSFYSDATLTFEWVDYAAGKMKFVSKYKNSSSESDEWGYEGYALDAGADEGFLQDVYYGYVDKTTGVIVVGTSKNEEKIGSGNYVFVPSDENIEESAIVSSGAGNNMPKAMTVTLKNGTAVSVIVYDGKVEFGVTFADIAGNALVASDLKELRDLAEGFTFIVKKSGADVVAYGVKNGEIVKLGLYYGVYEGGEGAPVLTLDGMGEAKLGEKVGSYVVKDEKVELTFVDGDGLVGEFYYVTFADGKYTAIKPMSEVSFNVGEGHDGKETVKVNTFTVFKLADHKLADTATQLFKGWKLNGELIATDYITVEEDITLEAVWAAKITVTFKYEDNGAHADETDTTLYANDTVTVKEVNFEFDGKVFAGWFTKNENGEFDTQITTGTALTDDVVLYAKWIEKSPFAGTYTVVRLNSSGSVSLYNSATTKLVVDNFGNADIQGYNGFSYGSKVAFAFANGSTTVLEITCVSSYSTSKYYAIYDAATGIIARASGSADLNTDDMFVFIPFDENYKTSDFAAYGFNAGGYRKILSFNDKTAENAARNVYTNANALYVNASFKDFDGNAVAVADIKNALNLFVYNGETLVEEFAKNSSGSFVTAIDEYKGRYADFNGILGQLFFNGAGVAKLGDEVGTYTQTETGFDVYLSNNTVYYSVELIADGETTMYIAEQPTVKITYNYMGHGVDKEEEVAKNVQYTVTEKPTAEGFKFWGWFEDEGLTTAAKTTYTPVEDKILYAKWTAAVTLKFDYNGQGTEAVVVADKYVGDNVSGIPAVAADVKFGEKVFAGWFLKHDDGSFGEEASTSTVLEGDTTYYAKWVDAPQSYGTYKGWNLYGTKSSATESSFSKEVLVVNANGTYKYGSKSGTLTDEQAAITDGAMVLDGTYYYFNKELGLMWRKYGGGKADGVGTDTDLGVDISKVSSVAYTGRSDVGSSYVAYLVITYKDETTKTAFLYNSIIVANATLEGAEATNITGKDFTVKVNGVTIVKVVGKTVLENDGLAGTYTGDYGEIIVDGYGNVTVGGVAVDYTVIAERTIKFVAANSMKEVIVDLGNGTYAKVLDGYQGTYTLPDNSTITLDGFGGAGDGKTYVVNGANITIFDGETSTTYGIDVANKKFLGKSVFAGYTFTGSYKDVWGDTAAFSIVFDDSPEIKGHFVTNSSVFVKFTAVLNGNTLTITVDAENCLSYDSGKTYKTDSGYSGKVIVMTLTGDTLKVVSTEIATNNYSFREGSAKCEGFSL